MGVRSHRRIGRQRNLREGQSATFIRINRIKDCRNKGPALQVAYNGKGMSPNDLNLSITFPTIAATGFDESMLEQ